MGDSGVSGKKNERKHGHQHLQARNLALSWLQQSPLSVVVIRDYHIFLIVKPAHGKKRPNPIVSSARGQKLDDLRRDLVALLPRLRRVAWALTQSEMDSLDLVQATVERALERGHGCQLGAGLEYWMLRVMKNLWIDQSRSRSRWGRLVSPIPDHVDHSDEGNESRTTEERIDMQRVKAAVEDLPEEQSIPIKLVLLGEMSYADAAAFLDIPIGTLTSRLARGRTALLRRFNQQAVSR